MPGRISAWGIYDVFTVKDGEQIFLAIVSDPQWAVFCEVLALDALRTDRRLRSNNDRVRARDWLIPWLRRHLAGHSAAALSAVFEKNSLPFAPITRPQDLFEDPHLNATGGLAPLTLPDGPGGGQSTRVPLLPLTLGGWRPGIRLNPPRVGEHTQALLAELGYSEDAIVSFQARQITR